MRNRRAALTAIAGAASLALTLTACGQNSDGGSKDSSGSTKGATIGISMPTKSSERWIGDGNNVVKDLRRRATRPSWPSARTTPTPRSRRSRT